MKTVLITLALIVLVVAGVGFYRGWFDFSSRNDESEASATLSVDKDRIEADKDKVLNKAQDRENQAEDELEPAPDKAQD